MATTTQHGAPQFPAAIGTVAPSDESAMDAAVQALQAQKDAWVALPVRERLALIDQMLADFAAVAPRWVAASLAAKGIGGDAPAASDEWAAGAYPVLRNLRLLRRTLEQIAATGLPHIAGPITTRADGQVVAQVFPQTATDRIFFAGVSADVWMEPDVTAATLPETMATVYRQPPPAGKVALVLGAGNVSSIGPMDVLYRLFVEDQVVLLKTNPVNAYLGPLIEEGFRALVGPGFLRVVHGGAREGAYLCQHPGIDEIHITGSDKTFDAIVFGGGAEGTARKAERRPLLQKRITGELGNVSPVIVVPGPWSASDLAYQAEHIATMLTNNAGFNCNATRVIIQQAGWAQREPLLQGVRAVLGRVATRDAYYPGARERQAAFVAAHPEAEQIGSHEGAQLPWTLIAGVDASKTDDICFTTEAFCSLFAETTLEAASPAEFVDRAVAFANERLWGTLNATLLVHPASLRDPAVAAAVERALAGLRYGTIGVNYWAGLGYALGITTWGAFPGHPLEDIQSGNGVVHNTLMFAKPQKSVITAPFRSTPTPPWFVTHGRGARVVFQRLCAFEVAPSVWKVPGILRAALGS